ncbi:dockerin type I domain-containing protein [Geoalkalibacter sp.]|uniref:dockerin type I domain-containing protein n=1 Tax=Geoalkalibacter sp. TaxID=3041440 RepID=UPI00272E660C|nr:dockerin type I domain-containing protein [Geoalkalibacter sp.]
MKRRFEPKFGCKGLSLFVLGVACCLFATSALAATKIYTTSGDFDLGTLLNVNHNAPNNDQLQLNVVGAGFPILWIANAGEDSLSKIDTTQVGASPGREVARYHTWFNTGPNATGIHGAWDGPAPSRTAVDIDGNAYVLNRHFDGRPPVLFKILANGFIDRNGNGVADTSFDANNDGVIQATEMKDLIDLNSNGIIDPNEIQDERIAWAIRVPDGIAAPLRPNGVGRALCIGTDGNLWVGLYNDYAFYKVNATNGATIAGPVSTSPTGSNPSAGAWTPYGCLVDKDGVLWSASLGNLLGKIENTSSNVGPYPVSSFNGFYNYGIALGQDPGDGRTIVYLGSVNGRSYTRFDSATNTFTEPAAVYVYSLGVNTDGAGNILVSNGSGGVIKFAPNGSVLWNSPAQSGTAGDSRGIMPDANNDVWQIHLDQSKTSKFRGTDGAALGVVPTGLYPYTYSDASGFAAANITVSTGTWNIIQDSGFSGTNWGTLSWNANVPAGATVTGRVRAADTVAGLQGQTFLDVNSGVPFTLTGRYLEAQVRLTAGAQGASPIVYDVTIVDNGQGQQIDKCDVDGDGDIDKADLALISRARNQSATGPEDPRDADGDGRITPNDVKVCTQECTRPNCSLQ